MVSHDIEELVSDCVIKGITCVWGYGFIPSSRINTIVSHGIEELVSY